MASKSQISPPALHNLLASEQALIKVGRKAQELRLHISMLSLSSEYFRGVFRSQLKEGLTRTITLSDIKYDTFSTFAYWLYTKHSSGFKRWLDHPSMYLRANATHHFVEVYILADRFLVHSLKEPTIEILVHLLNHHGCPSYWTITLAFENLPSDCRVLDLLVDAYCRIKDATQLKRADRYGTKFTDLPPEFIECTVVKLAEMVPKRKSKLKPETYKGKRKSNGDNDGEEGQGVKKIKV